MFQENIDSYFHLCNSARNYLIHFSQNQMRMRYRTPYSSMFNFFNRDLPKFSGSAPVILECSANLTVSVGRHLDQKYAGEPVQLLLPSQIAYSFVAWAVNKRAHLTAPIN
jgi:hypothetical protein